MASKTSLRRTEVSLVGFPNELITQLTWDVSYNAGLGWGGCAKVGEACEVKHWEMRWAWVAIVLSFHFHLRFKRLVKRISHFFYIN